MSIYMEPDYQKMYAMLCGAASDALDVLPATAETLGGRALLAQALEQAEELYLQTEGDGAEHADFS